MVTVSEYLSRSSLVADSSLLPIACLWSLWPLGNLAIYSLNKNGAFVGLDLIQSKFLKNSACRAPTKPITNHLSFGKYFLPYSLSQGKIGVLNSLLTDLRRQ